jgi:predicted transcriptional regulator
MTTQMSEPRNNDTRPHVADSSQANQLVIQQILRTQDEMMTRMEELTEASNALVATRTLPTENNIEKRLETQEQTIHHLREQQDKTNQLLSEMLHQMGKPAERTGAAGSI